jgi:uncharacterized protein
MSPHPPSRPMRRSEREITQPELIDEILTQASVLFLSLHDSPAPTVLPVCFGFEGKTLYVHSAPTGRKLDLIAANPQVGFSACTDMVVVPGDRACAYTCRARSVVGTGQARIVDAPEEKIRALDLIMHHYAPKAAELSYEPASLERTRVIAIQVQSMRAKRIG